MIIVLNIDQKCNYTDNIKFAKAKLKGKYKWIEKGWTKNEW